MAYPSYYILWEITPSEFPTTRYRITNNHNIQRTRPEIYINDETWFCCPIAVDGIEKATDDISGIKVKIALPVNYRPLQNGRLGTKPPIRPNTLMRRIITDSRALQERNFADGTLPHNSVSYNILKRDDFIVDRVISQSFIEVEAQLVSLKSSYRKTFRPRVKGRCYHEYRSRDCGYVENRYYNELDQQVTLESQDRCSLTVRGCSLRFPNSPLRFGGVPTQIQDQLEER